MKTDLTEILKLNPSYTENELRGIFQSVRNWQSANDANKREYMRQKSLGIKPTVSFKHTGA